MSDFVQDGEAGWAEHLADSTRHRLRAVEPPVGFDTQTGRVDLGPGYTACTYEDGYVHLHTAVSTGGRGNSSTYLKLRPSEARAVRDSLSAAIEKHAEDGS